MKKMKKNRGKLQFFIFWKIAIFLVFFHFFFIFLSFFYHFCFQWWNWWKMIKSDEKWLKNDTNMKKNMIKKKWKKNSRKVAIFQKMKNCNFPRVFFIFFIFFHVFSFFYHVSSFLFPVVQKFCKKWTITIFLEFFSFFYKIVASSGGIDEKW